MTNCNINLSKGSIKNLNCTASGGSGKYLYELYINNSKVNQSPINSPNTYVFQYQFNTLGTFNMYVLIKDENENYVNVPEQSCIINVTNTCNNITCNFTITQ